MRLLEAISKMFADGRCPRQYDRYSDKIDARDFMDSPLWAAIALTGYIKETGDFSLAEEEVGFLGSEEKSSVKDHLLRAFDYLYRARGKNGLLLMQDGWLPLFTFYNFDYSENGAQLYFADEGFKIYLDTVSAFTPEQ